MLTRPTTEQVLLGIARDLHEDVLPHLTNEPARVALGMIDQLLRGCAQRAAHEIAWMAEEAAAIDEVTADLDDRAVVEAREALAGAGPVADSLHLDEACAHYDLASRVLSAGIEAAYARGDAELVERLRPLVEARSARELEIIGQFDLVGRG